MKLVKKVSKELAVLVMALMMAVTPNLTMAANKGNVTYVKTQQIAKQDDFYAAINADWLRTAKIKPGDTGVDTFSELSDKCEDQISALFNEILSNSDKYKLGSSERNMINLYNDYRNMDKRNEVGITPLKPYFDQIKNIKTIDDVDAYLSDMFNNQNAGLYTFNVATDFKDSTKKVITLSSTSLTLGDADGYNKPDEQYKKMSTLTKDMIVNDLVLMGYSKEDAEKKYADFYKLEATLAKHKIGKEEASQDPNIYEKVYNKYTLDEADKLAPNLKIKDKVTKIFGNNVSNIVVEEVDWLKDMNAYYKAENLDSIKNFLEIRFMLGYVSCTTAEFKKVQDTANAALMGSQGETPLDKEAFQLVNSVFSQDLGKLYVEKYFTAAEKTDVEGIVKSIITDYKAKLQNVDWMSDATKQNAIKKLDNMTIKIGYPDKWSTYDDLTLKSFEDGSSLVENMLELTKFYSNKIVEDYATPVDKAAFIMPPQMVNACYDPTNNDITFPAAILQSPFYDPNRSREANLGSIGVVIAHEISHAFDTTGANFDEKGNLNSWWTEEDYTKFQEKASSVRTFFSGIKTEDGANVNGDLTVGENIADITAMSCMLDIMKTIPDANYEEFFEAWASTWKSVYTPEYKALLLQQDSHSPDKVRANQVVQQFQEFYDTYGVKEGDGMYLAPDKRVRIF